MRFATYQEFWPFYLAQHTQWANKVLHSIGLLWALTTVIASFYYQNFWLFLMAFPVGYGPAWVGHFFFEKNKPATFGYPFWSFISDFRMVYLFLTGKIR